MHLAELAPRTPAIVDAVEDRAANDPVARRLRELGFVGGEEVRILAAGPFGAEPLLVQVGFTRFALRRAEAARVRLRPPQASA
ncbi:FeoA family protein [Thermomonas brevis]